MLQNYKRSLLLRNRMQNANNHIDRLKQARAFSTNKEDKNFNPFKVGMGSSSKGEYKGTLTKLMNFFSKNKEDLKGTKSNDSSSIN
jgi:hypothetical protein